MKLELIVIGLVLFFIGFPFIILLPYTIVSRDISMIFICLLFSFIYVSSIMFIWLTFSGKIKLRPTPENIEKIEKMGKIFKKFEPVGKINFFFKSVPIIDVFWEY